MCCLLVQWVSHSGAEILRAGSRVKARGSLTTTSAKEAVKTSLDSQLAQMQSGADDGPSADAGDKNEGKNKNKKRGKPKTKKVKTAEEIAKKELLKDIKACFGLIIILPNKTCNFHIHNMCGFVLP